MSKVVCEVCGTAYAETANQCPICGTAKPDQSQPAQKADGEGYAYVKGGRFAPANVKKRNSGKQEQADSQEEKPQKQARKEAEEPKERPARKSRKSQDEPEDAQPSNTGLIIVVVVLLLAIISLCAYIAIRYINMNNDRNNTQPSDATSSVTTPVEIPCTGITIPGMTSYTFTDLSEIWQVEVTCNPKNTTDMLNWEYDNTIVRVQPNGNYWEISPVGPGEARITVKCGEYSAVLTVVCNVTMPTEPTEPTEPTQPTDPEFILELSKEDFTMHSYGEKVKIYSGSKDASEITWYSDNEAVAIIENGVVTAVGPGNCKVFGVYGDQIVSCIVRCSKDVVKPEEGEYYLAQQYKTSAPAKDVTIAVGEYLLFSIRKADGTKVTEGVTFSVSDETFITVDADGRVTGVAATVGTGKVVYVYAEYNGEVYECIVRVKNPQ